jgi:hypothetical protein
MPGTEMLSESEITKKLEREGYSNISLQRASGRQQMGGAAGAGQQTQTAGVSDAAGIETHRHRDEGRQAGALSGRFEGPRHRGIADYLL